MQVNLSKEIIETVCNTLRLVDATATKQAKSHLGAGDVEFLDAYDLFNDLYSNYQTEADAADEARNNAQKRDGLSFGDAMMTHAERDKAAHIAAHNAYMARFGQGETR
jgi:hypothetical protein